MRYFSAVLITLLFALGAPAEVRSVLERVPTPDGQADVWCKAVEIVVPSSSGDELALMHAYAYSLDGAGDRPIMFLWNGGPGVASALLHTSFAGPLVAPIGDEEPADLRHNPLTLIDLADLVYVDPVGTGLSRVFDDDGNAAFWGVREDAEAAAEFVARYLDERGLSSRPVYLCGESYGAIRVAAMLDPLSERGIEAEGLVLISPALESRALNPRTDSTARTDRADRLPTHAAISLAKGTRRADDARRFIDEACLFAHGPYLAVMRSSRRLPEPVLDQLRSLRDRFTADRDTSGRDRYDARYPLESGVMNGLEISEVGEATRTLLARVFRVETDGRYLILNREANTRWRAPGGRRGLARSDIRATRMIAEAGDDGDGPRVLIAGGWYDLVTPFAIARRLASEGAFGECDVTVADYPAGHVIYADPDAHRALTEDLREWWKDN